MSKIIDDYNVSTPTNSTGGVNIPVPASPSTITLALFGLAVVSSSTNKVQLEATVGFQSTVGVPDLLFQIFRDTSVIFSIRTGTLAVGENDSIDFTAADLNVPIGYHAYKLTVTNVSPNSSLNQGTIQGPITFSGITIV